MAAGRQRILSQQLSTELNRAALENARAEMLLTKSAEGYLLGKLPVGDITRNKVFQLFQVNRYDPVLAANILVRWARREFNKCNRHLVLQTCDHQQDKPRGGYCPCCAILWLWKLD